MDKKPEPREGKGYCESCIHWRDDLAQEHVFVSAQHNLVPLSIMRKQAKQSGQILNLKPGQVFMAAPCTEGPVWQIVGHQAFCSRWKHHNSC